MSDSTKLMLSGFYEMGQSVREYIDQNGGGGGGGGGISSSSDILAWGVFSGTEGAGNNYLLTLQEGYNISGVTRIQDGRFKVVFDNELDSEFYSVSASCNPYGYNGAYAGVEDLDPPTTNGFVLDVRTVANAYTNSNRISFTVVGSGAGGGGSSSAGAIGNNETVQAESSFGSTIPDAILVKNNNVPVQWRFRVIVSGTPGLIEYVGLGSPSAYNRTLFNNDLSGTIQLSPTAGYSFYDGATSLQDIIDNGHAIYYGGSSSNGASSVSGSSTFASLTDTPTGFESGKYLVSTSSGVEWTEVSPSAGGGGGSSSAGGIGSNSTIQSNSNFDGVLPDQIIAELVGGESVFDLRYISSSVIKYVDSLDDSSDSGLPTTLDFTNDSSGSYINYTNANHANYKLVSSNKISISEFIETGRAIYLGGGSSSNGGSTTGSIGPGNLPQAIENSNFSGRIPDFINGTNAGEYVPLYLSEVYRKSSNPTEIRYKTMFNQHLIFNNNESGTYKNTSSSSLQALTGSDGNQFSLKQYISSGEAGFVGGSSSASKGPYSALLACGTAGSQVLSSSSDFIDSINYISSPAGTFDIVFKDGTFTEPPVGVFSVQKTSDATPQETPQVANTNSIFPLSLILVMIMLPVKNIEFVLVIPLILQHM